MKEKVNERIKSLKKASNKGKKEQNHNEPHRDARLSCALVSAVANTPM